MRVYKPLSQPLGVFMFKLEFLCYLFHNMSMALFFLLAFKKLYRILHQLGYLQNLTCRWFMTSTKYCLEKIKNYFLNQDPTALFPKPSFSQISFTSLSLSLSLSLSPLNLLICSDLFVLSQQNHLFIILLRPNSQGPLIDGLGIQRRRSTWNSSKEIDFSFLYPLF